MTDALFFLAVAVLAIGPWLLLRGKARDLWLGLFIGIAVLVGIGEGVSLLLTRQTLSQLFWTFSETNRAKAWLVLVFLAASGLMILAHLARRLLRKRK